MVTEGRFVQTTRGIGHGMAVGVTYPDIAVLFKGEHLPFQIGKLVQVRVTPGKYLNEIVWEWQIT